MKNLFFLLFMTILLNSCATTNKMTNEAIHHAIIGQNEKSIYSRVGIPTSIVPAPDGGKIMIYEYYSKGMYTTPYKSKVTYNANRNLTGDREGLILRLGENTATNDPKYTIYEKNVSYLKAYLDKQGNCVRFEQNLPKEQLEMYHERFKHYLPKD
ncbi:MAG: hypothetical protein HQ521_10235 [Bacteroidetes bacterium]|nr:hypothetical protein [Bacteroidota bacterium]